MGNRINYDYIEDYIDRQTVEGSLFSHAPKRALLDRIKQEAEKQDFPILRTQLEAVLRWIIALSQPKSILEIGTCIGYSAITMLDSAPEDCRLTTIECDEDILIPARKNFADAGLSERITVFCGDSGQILPLMQGSFDLIYLDAAKAQYLALLPDCLRLLKPGGLFVCDDVLFYGMISGDRSLLNRRKITIVKRMRVFIDTLMKNNGLETLLLPVGDGICIGRKLPLPTDGTPTI